MSTGLLLFTSGLFGQTTVNQGNTDNAFKVDNQQYKLNYHAETYRDFKIPATAAGKFIKLSARGADGGRINYKDLSKVGKGGQGASVSGLFKIGSASNEIPVGATIRFIMGQKGTSHTNDMDLYRHGGGGGGGTGIVLLPAGVDPATSDAADWTILMVAGGGGGGYSKRTGFTFDGNPGNDGENGTGEIPSSESFAEGRTPGKNRQAGYSGGGGTTLDPLKDLVDPELDGFQAIASYEHIQPTGQKGEQTSKYNSGGFGFGAGSASDQSNHQYIGAGGGYSGGHQGYIYQVKTHQAGGGGSYVNADYALIGTAVKKKNGTTANPGNGYINYQFSTVGPVSLHSGKEFAKGTVLLSTASYVLSFQGDGNLVLRNSGNAIWATGTNGQGTRLIFQGDGNLLLRNSSNNAIWATGTADAQKSGHGGRLLSLLTNGNLVITNDINQIIWQTNTGQ